MAAIQETVRAGHVWQLPAPTGFNQQQPFQVAVKTTKP